MTTANTLAALVNSSSQVVVPSGGINFGTSTDGTGTVTSGVMDDYEEGTWNPAYSSTGGGTATMGSDTYGVYVRTGNVVYVTASLEMGTNSLLAGDLNITGLPFTPSGTSGYRNSTAFFSYTVNIIPQPFGATFNTGQNYMEVWVQGNNARYPATNVANAARAVVSGFYFTI